MEYKSCSLLDRSGQWRGNARGGDGGGNLQNGATTAFHLARCPEDGKTRPLTQGHYTKVGAGDFFPQHPDMYINLSLALMPLRVRGVQSRSQVSPVYIFFFTTFTSSYQQSPFFFIPFGPLCLLSPNHSLPFYLNSNSLHKIILHEALKQSAPTCQLIRYFFAPSFSTFS